MSERGFATSGAYLVIGLAVFIAMGTLYSAVSNTTERVTEAQQAAQERRLEVMGSAALVTDAVWNSTTSNLTVRVNNTGETTLAVEDTDVLVDGQYVALSAFERVEIGERSSPDRWRPGEQLVLVDDDTVADLVTTPDRVKVVAEGGVADTREVTVVS